ncbi:hypothetical protein DSO57_1039046 [Entomophthora muscae]|uniref:Uncharacterized protein n=1 Tax=Entomophthora muscae TaxID=34485 RepID=A0ACC2S0L2_9FUNG|nr:hypothetical protein DSO57_1039046 [Entomophthora muscae]
MPAEKVSTFINNIYTLLSREENRKYLSWTEDGTSFIIHSIREFQNYFLQSHFKHQKIESFFRQLTVSFLFYTLIVSSITLSELPTEENSRGRGLDTCCGFGHEHFMRGRPELLYLVMRKETRRYPPSPKKPAAPLKRHQENTSSYISLLPATANPGSLSQKINFEATGKHQSKIAALALGSNDSRGLFGVNQAAPPPS